MLLLTGCAMGTGDPFVNYHRKQFLAAHPSLEPSTREAIQAGRILPGMSRAEVMAAWGPPKTCSSVGSRVVCLYEEQTPMFAGRQTYTDRRYNSVVYERGAVVDWQLH
jgi:hypothetical protein